MKRILLFLIMSIMFLSACKDKTIKKINKNVNPVIIENTDEGLSSKGNYKKNVQISIDKNVLIDNLKNICLNTRKYGTEGEKNTLNYLVEKFKEYGYITTIQEFPVYKQNFRSTYVTYCKDYFKENPYNSQVLGMGKNIIAKRDNHSHTKKSIYLTAHYDTTPNTMGVIDNGTGVSAVLEIARQLKNFDSPFNIVVVLFSAEEYFRTGSRAFVSSLSNEEKENTIGVINIDMVGEKDAGDLIIRANKGEHNILTLMINDQLENKLPILEGGYSDELSFYLDKIPSITLTNKDPDLKRDKENDQFQYINLDELKNVAQLISNFLISFDLKVYNENLSQRSFASNKAKNYKGLTDEFYPEKLSAMNGFKLTKVNAVLLENGYDSETEYIFEDEKDKKYIITKRFKVFIEPTIYSNFKTLVNDYKYNLPLYFVHEDSKSAAKVSYVIRSYFGEIRGDISVDTALDILKKLLYIS